MRNNFFQLMQQIFPPTNRPWRIVETFTTSDGIRSRVCDGTWQTQEEAMDVLSIKEERCDNT